MKITSVETFHIDAGWRPWTYVKVSTDEGLVGWGECSDSRSPLGIAGCIADYQHLLIGQDPRPIERLYWDMLRHSRQNLGGVSHKAIAGVELALWDLKGKALGVPVYELFGGPMRERVRLYWSHCGTTRARHGKALGLPPLRSYEDVKALGQEVVERGFSALKTNIVIPGDPAETYFPGFDRGAGSTDGTVSLDILRKIEKLIGAFSEGVGSDIQIALDLNYNFRTEGAVKIARMCEQFNMQWVEYDNWDPKALLQLKESTTNSIASLESLVSTRQFRPFLELQATDVAIIDVPWNGFSQAIKIAGMAEAYEINIAPHNYYSHLADLISINLCASLPNVRVMEIDVDDVPWKKELVKSPPTIKDGYIEVPTGPGWGSEVDEEVVRAHPWPVRSGSRAGSIGDRY
jgi:L-alanine-DL-glutamate epimerase-like enolase superfamily enzyme